jgi:hypothetical protein
VPNCLFLLCLPPCSLRRLSLRYALNFLVDRLLATFRSAFNRTARLVGSVEAVLARSLATLGTGGCIRLLLRGVIRSGEGCGSATSTSEDRGKPSEDTFCEFDRL